MEPMETAKRFAELTRRKRDLEADLNRVKKELQPVHDELLAAIEAGQFPRSSKVGGFTVYLKHDVWASVVEGGIDALKQHDELADYVKEAVNGQSLSAWVRDQMRNQEVEDAVDLVLDEPIKQALKISDTYKIQAQVA